MLTNIDSHVTHCEGALSGMPAVRAFALYAGMALLIDFVMQVILAQIQIAKGSFQAVQQKCTR